MENKNIDSKHLLHVILKKKRYLCTLSLGCIFVTMASLMYFTDPLENCARHLTKLYNGSAMYERLNEDMVGVSIEIYLFNVTNAQRFMDGRDPKLKLEEVGPFVYRQVRRHKNLSIDDNEHIIKYTPLNTNKFDINASIGDPEKMHLMLPNIPLLLMASKVSTDYSFLKFTFPSRDPVINITVQEYLWGYDDTLVAMGNMFFPNVFHFKQLGLLDRFFDPVNYKPLELDATDDDKFAIKSMGGFGGLKGLNYDTKPSYCNSFNDTFEGVIFPFKMSPTRPVRLYHNIYCRMLDLEYIGTENMEYGNQGMVYRIKKDAFTHNKENNCLCPTGGCVDGISDLSPCFYGFPLGMSLAHFLYENNTKLTEKIEGMKPDEALHGSRFTIDKVIGVSLETSFTIQYNLMTSDLSFLYKSRKFSNMILPFIWIRVVQPPLPDDVNLNIIILNMYMPRVLLTIEVLFIAIGSALFYYSYRKITRNTFRNRKMDYRDSNVTQNIVNTEMPLIDKY